jgi:Tfp pilus assembly protein PilF
MASVGWCTMRRFPRFDTVMPLLLICVLSFITEPLAAQRVGAPNAPRSNTGMGTGQAKTYVVSGEVSDGESHTSIENVMVYLNSFTGGTVASAFAGGNGSFVMNNVPGGSYELVVEQLGYQPFHQRVDVQADYYGLLVELRPIPSVNRSARGSQVVSKRELSIPHNAHDDMQKGLTLLNAKSDYKGSVKQFERAVHEYPDYYEAYTEMGVAYIHLGDAVNAEQTLRKAVDMSEQHYGDALYWLALFLSNSQKFADAEPLARKAVELDANSWQANSELARALDGLGRPADAEPSALAAVKIRPDNANLYLILANIHGELQNEPALLDDLNSYLKLAPTGPFASQAREQRDQVQRDLQNTKASPATPSGQNP